MKAEPKSQVQGVDYFYRGHIFSSIQERASVKMRKKMFDHWHFRFAKGAKRVLDIGATPDINRSDSNCMIPWLKDAFQYVDLFSIEDIQHLSRLFPSVGITQEIVRYKMSEPVLPDYDWVSCSAVLEHVGSSANQLQFVLDCLANGRGVFLTTPNRWHWMEFHTKIPLVHWLPKKFHRQVLRWLGLSMWSREEHLNLVSARDLRRIAQECCQRVGNRRWEVKSYWFFGMPSNLSLIISPE